MTTDSTAEFTGRSNYETSFKGISGKPAGEGLKVLKNLVTGGGGTENQNAILSLLEDTKLRDHFGQHWEKGQKAIERTRKVSSHRDSVTELKKIVGEDIALVFVTLEKALGLAFRGAGAKLGREEKKMPSRKYAIPFEKMSEPELANVYENYLSACRFFSSAFHNAVGENISKIREELMPFKGA